jgi:phosphatidylglycerophosphatase A
MKFDFRLFFLTVGFSGLSPKASGTVGTIASLPLGIAILMFFPPLTLFLLTILITVLAVKSINQYEKETGTHDSKIIVIDELAGLWLAFSLSIPGQIQEFSDEVILAIILNFVLFRLFDIWKPSIIGKIDKNVPGGLGVMGDDILAGLVAGILTATIIHYNLLII